MQIGKTLKIVSIGGTLPLDLFNGFKRNNFQKLVKFDGFERVSKCYSESLLRK